MPLATAKCAAGWAHDDWFRYPLSDTDHLLNEGCGMNVTGYYVFAGSLGVLHCLSSITALWSAARSKTTRSRVSLVLAAVSNLCWSGLGLSAPFASANGVRSGNSWLLFLLALFPFAACLLIAVYIFFGVSLKDLKRNTCMRLGGSAVLISSQFNLVAVLIMASAGDLQWGYTRPLPMRVALGFRGFCFSAGVQMGVIIAVSIYFLTVLIQAIEQVTAGVSNTRITNKNQKTLDTAARFRRFRTVLAMCSPLACGVWTLQAIILPLYWWVFLLHSLNVLMAMVGVTISMQVSATTRSSTSSTRASIRGSEMVSVAVPRPSSSAVYEMKQSVK